MITDKEKIAIQKYWPKPFEELTPEYVQVVLKELRIKYHPDLYAKYNDEVVQEMFTERFQEIELLEKRLQDYFSGKKSAVNGKVDHEHPNARFAFDELKVEVMTGDKDLKYHLFESHYRFLLGGVRFKIPGTAGAYLIIDESHQGTRVGFQEAIRMYITFGISDSVEDVVDWLYERVKGRASSIIIHGKATSVDRLALLQAVKKEAYLELGP